MKRIILLSVILISFGTVCFAQPIGFNKVAQSKYFNIYSTKEINLLQLIRRLDIRSEYLLIKEASYMKQQPQIMLGALFDAIFLEACDVLHMYLYKFKVNIKICQNQRELNRIYRELLAGKSLKAPAFYLHKTNSIYINVQYIQPESFAYEVAHAVIAHYFAVLPPVRVRETLAKDVGYQIRKLTK